MRHLDVPFIYLRDEKEKRRKPFEAAMRILPDKPHCAQCGGIFSPKKTPGGPKRIYNLCPDCEADITRQIKGPALARYLETLPAPALVVNRDLRVIAYNLNCLLKLCGNEPNPNGLLLGEFLECHNAALPERCGASPACLDCGIRRTVFDTLRSGRPQEYIPAVITVRNGGLGVQRDFLISTEKLGELVQITVGKASTFLGGKHESDRELSQKREGPGAT